MYTVRVVHKNRDAIHLDHAFKHLAKRNCLSATRKLGFCMMNQIINFCSSMLPTVVPFCSKF